MPTMFDETCRERLEVEVGDFVTEFLVTDTRIWEVVKVTAQTIVVRTTKEVGKPEPDPRCDVGGYGFRVMLTEMGPDPIGGTMRLKVRKDGTIRMFDRGHPLRKVNGTPRKRVDYRV